MSRVKKHIVFLSILIIVLLGTQSAGNAERLAPPAPPAKHKESKQNEKNFDERTINNTFSIKALGYSYYSIYLKKGAMLSYSIEVLRGGNRDIDIWLMDNKGFVNFSNRMNFEYFTGYSAKKIMKANYTFLAPEDGVYNLVLDNTFSTLTEKTVFVYAYIIGEGYLTRVEPKFELFKELDEYLHSIYKNSKELFILPEFQVSMESCGQPNAFCRYNPPKITVCYEYIDKFINFSQDKEKVKKLINATFLHELGHLSLYKWDYPFYDNEDSADEFKTVILLIEGDVSSALEDVQLYDSEVFRAFFDSIAKVLADDRHSLSPQRARNMRRWLNNSNDLMRRWQKILVPHFQTKILEDMMNRPKSWTDTQLVSEELEKRRQLKETQKSDKTKEKEKSFDEIIKEIEDETRREKNK